jgi:diacylglycerol kinase (ATP)
MTEKKKWIFIINPVAGNGFAAGMVNEITKMAEVFNADADIVLSEKKGHATNLAQQSAREGYKYIIAVGGDGTFNEVASPLVNFKDVVTGIIPAGTGNDFIQILGYPDRFNESDWKQFFSQSCIRMDVGSCNGMYFFNGMGLGFDAQVAAENYTAPGEVRKGGKNKYIWHILKTLLFFREKKMKFIADGENLETNIFMNTISIGRRFAGDFLITPRAIANDSLLDICMVSRLSLYRRLRILLLVPKGKHIYDERITYYQSDKLTIDFGEKVPFHLDGELNFADKFELTILPKALNVIFNPSGNHFFYL